MGENFIGLDGFKFVSTREPPEQIINYDDTQNAAEGMAVQSLEISSRGRWRDSLSSHKTSKVSIWEHTIFWTAAKLPSSTGCVLHDYCTLIGCYVAVDEKRVSIAAMHELIAVAANETVYLRCCANERFLSVMLVAWNQTRWYWWICTIDITI